MDIDVSFFGRFRELATRQQIVTLDSGARLGDLIEWLIKEFGIEFKEETKKTKSYAIMANKRYCDLSTHRNTPLKDGDVVAFMPIVAGG
jgi:MoaD family protein